MMRRSSFTLLIIAVMALCLLLSTTAAAAIPTYNWYQTGGPVSGPSAVAVFSKDGTLPVVVERSMYLDGKAAGTDTIGAFSD